MILVYSKEVVAFLPENPSLFASGPGKFNQLREEVDLSQHCHPLRGISRGEEFVDFEK